MHGSFIKNRSCTNLPQASLLYVGKYRGEESCWDGCYDLKYIHKPCDRYTKPCRCEKFSLTQTTLLSVGKQRGSEDSWLIVVTRNLYTNRAEAFSQNILLIVLSGTKHTSVHMKKERCRVQRVLGMIVETCYIYWILARNWSPIPRSRANV